MAEKVLNTLKIKKHTFIKKRISRSVGGDMVILFFLAVGALFMAVPMLFAITSSLKPANEFWIFPPRFFVKNPTLKNFTDLFGLMSNSWVPFTRYIFNTLFITATGTAGHVIAASMCAYPLAKFKFPGSSLFFKAVVLSLMFSATVTSVPNYLIMTKLGLINTQLAIIIPAFGMPLGLFLMKQFMEQGIPSTMLEAANIDGAGEVRILFQIVMPIVKPAWLTLIIFSVQGLWGLGNTPFIFSEQLKTLSFAFSQIATAGIARAGVGAAIMVIMMIVPVSVFILTQSNIVETMSTSGMKE